MKATDKMHCLHCWLCAISVHREALALLYKLGHMRL